VRASMARLGRMSERRDWGVLVSPPLLAELWVPKTYATRRYS
jgi:hypothetical protein